MHYLATPPYTLNKKNSWFTSSTLLVGAWSRWHDCTTVDSYAASAPAGQQLNRNDSGVFICVIVAYLQRSEVGSQRRSAFQKLFELSRCSKRTCSGRVQMNIDVTNIRVDRCSEQVFFDLSNAQCRATQLFAGQVPKRKLLSHKPH